MCIIPCSKHQTDKSRQRWTDSSSQQQTLMFINEHHRVELHKKIPPTHNLTGVTLTTPLPSQYGSAEACYPPQHGRCGNY